MSDPTEERILGDLPELPDHVWTAALDHAFDPQAEPDATLVPTDDPAELDADDTSDGLAVLDETSHDPFDATHDPFDVDHPYGDDTCGHDHDQPGFSDTDGFF